MDDENASNIIWIFHVGYEDSPAEAWNQLENYYPGDDYVDIVAVSVYGAQTPLDDGSSSFAELMDDVYPRLANLSTKPIIIAEFGATSGVNDFDRNKWAEDALKDITSNRWPLVIGFSWWNEWWQNDNNPQHDSDMRIQADEELAEIFKNNVGGNDMVLSELQFC
jgi:beta-mannanase